MLEYKRDEIDFVTECVNEVGRIAGQVVSPTNAVDQFTKFIVEHEQIPRVVIVEKFFSCQMVLEIVHLQRIYERSFN